MLSSRTGSDYGLDATVTSIFHYYPLVSFQEDLWGVPANPLHDPLRLNPPSIPTGQATRLSELRDLRRQRNTSTDIQGRSVEPCGVVESLLKRVRTVRKPLSSEPDHLRFSARLLSGRALLRRRSNPRNGHLAADDGCDQLSFNPSLYAQPTTTATDSASGIDVNSRFPSS